MLLLSDDMKHDIVYTILEYLGDKPTLVFYDTHDEEVATLRLNDPPFTKMDKPGVVTLYLKDRDFIVKKYVPRYVILTATNGDNVYRTNIGFSHGFDEENYFYNSDAEIILLGKPSRGCTISFDYITLTLAS